MRLVFGLAFALFAGLLPAQFVPDVVTYLDATAATHQTQFTTLSGQGYRPISLCVSGGLSSARYSAVWIRRAGATYVGIHGATAAAYTTWRDQQRVAGYRPMLVTTAGTSADTVYAGVWVRDGVDAIEHVEQPTSDLQAKSQWAYDNDYQLACVSVRGDATLFRWASVWVKNDYEDGWCFATSAVADYAADFNARVDGYGRLISAQTMPNGSVAQVWRDDAIGGWLTLPDLTESQVLTEISSRRPSGYYPTSIHARGTGTAARYHVVFATRDLPLTRTLTRSGLGVIGMDGFDQYMEDHVRAHGIRASAIAITKDGRLVFARGYTLAESGYPQTQPTSLFRIASATKTLTGLATHLLIQRGGTISNNTLAGSYLGLSGYHATFDQIRVHHLLAHRAGLYADNTSWGVANWLNSSNPTLPVSSWNTARCIAGTAMRAAPATDYLYSNLGYYLLGSMVERASGKTYERFIREDLAAPMGVTRIWVGANERSQLRSGEVEYRNRDLEITPSELYTDRRTVSVQFGGGGDDNLTRRAGAGGIVTSPVDYVRLFAGAFDMACDGGVFTQPTVDTMLGPPVANPGANPCGFDSREVRTNGVIACGKNGQLWGSSTQVIYRSDGVAIAVFDGKQNSNANRDTLNTLADAVATWPAHDLFPTYGLAAFQRVCPRVYGVQNTSLPNVTDSPFVIDGDVLAGVDRISFGSHTITSRGSNTWADGWFRIVSDDRIELYPPQGLVPTTYTVRLHNSIFTSTPFDVSLTRQTTLTLGGPNTALAGFELVAARGPASSQSLALLCLSDSNRPSSAPGIVDLGLGNNFASLITWPIAVPFGLLSGAARWSIPRVPGTWYFQTAIADPNARNPLPMPVTNVRSVRVN